MMILIMVFLGQIESTDQKSYFTQTTTYSTQREDTLNIMIKDYLATNEGAGFVHFVTDLGSDNVDEATGVKCFCPYEGCNMARLFYDSDKQEYQCAYCGRTYPYPRSPQSVHDMERKATLQLQQQQQQPDQDRDAGGERTISAVTNSPTSNRKEHFIMASPREPRGLAGIVDPEAFAEMYKPELTQEQLDREKRGQYNWVEVEVSRQSPNVLDSAVEAKKIQREWMRKQDQRFLNSMRGSSSSRRNATSDSVNNNNNNTVRHKSPGWWRLT